MLRVPRLRQPDPTACLPTCVLCVLRYYGHAAEYRDVRAWCHSTPSGSDPDLAVQGLADAAVDAQLLQCSSEEELRELIEDGVPPIAALALGNGYYHTVVVCGVGENSVTVMDPMAGDYIDVPLSEFLMAWTPASGEVILLTGPPNSDRAPSAPSR